MTRTWLDITTLLVWGAAWSSAVGCGGGSVGAEGSECYPNGTYTEIDLFAESVASATYETRSYAITFSGTHSDGGLVFNATLDDGETVCFDNVSVTPN